jgi:hypothetical protein
MRAVDALNWPIVLLVGLPPRPRPAAMAESPRTEPEGSWVRRKSVQTHSSPRSAPLLLESQEGDMASSSGSDSKSVLSDQQRDHVSRELQEIGNLLRSGQTREEWNSAQGLFDHALCGSSATLIVRKTVTK